MHTPYRAWCIYCVKAQASTPSYRRVSDKNVDERVPRVSMDNLYFGKTPVLCIKESRYKLVYALAVSQKGSSAEYVVARVASILDENGHENVDFI